MLGCVERQKGREEKAGKSGRESDRKRGEEQKRIEGREKEM